MVTLLVAAFDFISLYITIKNITVKVYSPIHLLVCDGIVVFLRTPIAFQGDFHLAGCFKGVVKLHGLWRGC